MRISGCIRCGLCPVSQFTRDYKIVWHHKQYYIPVILKADILESKWNNKERFFEEIIVFLQMRNMIDQYKTSQRV